MKAPVLILLLLAQMAYGQPAKLLYKGRYVVIFRLMELSADGKQATFDSGEGKISVPWSAVSSELKTHFQKAYTDLSEKNAALAQAAAEEKAQAAKLEKAMLEAAALGKEPGGIERLEANVVPVRQVETNLLAYVG